jgi:hypothetical protein
MSKCASFICPTNVSGHVLSSVLYNNTLFGPRSYTADDTLYKHLHETVRDTDMYTQILFSTYILGLVAK